MLNYSLAMVRSSGTIRRHEFCDQCCCDGCQPPSCIGTHLYHPVLCIILKYASVVSAYYPVQQLQVDLFCRPLFAWHVPSYVDKVADALWTKQDENEVVMVHWGGSGDVMVRGRHSSGKLNRNG